MHPQNDKGKKLRLGHVERLVGESQGLVRHLQWNSYLSKQYRILYVSTPKVACTSLKWWFACLEGYAQALHGIADSDESDPDLVVHESHKVAPHVTGLKQEDLSEALSSDSYFRFAVVRNPYERLFSAWQSKILVREPHQARLYPNSEFLHYPVNDERDIAAAFEAFLEHLAANEAPSYWDHHWTPQADLLRPDLITYSQIAKIEQAPELSKALVDWIGQYVPDPFGVRRANESLIPYAPEFLTNRSAELIASLYSVDFDIFGYERTPPSRRKAFSREQLDVALKAIGLIRGRHQQLELRAVRIAELGTALSAREGEIIHLNQKLSEVGEQIASLQLAVDERSAEIVDLNGTVADRDRQVASLGTTVGQKDNVISRSDSEIARLHDAIGGRDSEIVCLHDAIGECDSEIARLHDAIGGRDSEIARLHDAIGGRDSEIARLHDAIGGRDSEIARLHDAIGGRDTEIASLHNAIGERDGQIAHLTTEIAKRLIDRDDKLSALQHAYDQIQRSISGRLFVSLPRILGVGRQERSSDAAPAKRFWKDLLGGWVAKSSTRTIRASSLFDADYYRAAYPDLKDADLDLASHYFVHGWRELRNPSPLFNTAQYLSDNPDVARVGVNPLVHYLKHGKREGRALAPAPSVLAEPGGPDNAPAAIDSAALEYRTLSSEELAAEVDAIHASGLFDERFYVSMYADLELSPDAAIRHYCERGWQEGRNPSDEFDTQFYLATYHDIRNAGLNPFWHYATSGWTEHRHALPDLTIRHENDVWFGAIESDIKPLAFYSSPDWNGLRRGRPAFKGHAYPPQPAAELGHYAPVDWQVLKRQAQMAVHHGIVGFVFDLDIANFGTGSSPIDHFLAHADIEIGFCPQVELSPDIPTMQLVEALAPVLTDCRQIHVGDRPVLVARAADPGPALDGRLAELRRLLVDAGMSNPFMIGRSAGSGDEAALAGSFDAVLSLPRVEKSGAFSPVDKNGTHTIPYSVVASHGVALAERDRDAAHLFYHAITVGHDNTPQGSEHPLVYTRFTMGDYRRWLDAVIDMTRAVHAPDRRLLFLDAWNNWSTGSVLEPDKVGGFARLNETARALANLESGLRMPKVSVIVPNYNHERFLRRRLDSIYQQTYRNIEVILMDDCSSDRSKSILDEYASVHPEITRRIYNNGNSGGPFRQWAKGLRCATGDLVWIAESDDFCDELFLEVLVRCFDDEAVMLAYGSSVFVDAREIPMQNGFVDYVSDLDCAAKWTGPYVETAHNEVRQALGIKNTIPNASGVLFRRPIGMALLDDDSWQSMRVAGDWVFYLHVLRGGKIAFRPEAINFFRRYPGSTAELTYRKESFYREVGLASRAVAALYDVPWSILERCRNGYEAVYREQIGGDVEQFESWYNYSAVVQARDGRLPNIMISTMGFYPGGAEILPIRMANEFKRQGHSVLLLSANLNPREDGVRRMLQNDVPLVETPEAEDVRAIIDDFGIEALNTHQWHIQKYPIHVPNVFDRLRTHVASLHGMIEHGEAFEVTQDQLSRADKKVTTWIYTADKNLGPFSKQGLYKKNSPKFMKIPNGMQPPTISPVDRAQLNVPEEAFVLCCVSRAIPDKGWAETIAAVEKARAISGRDIRLILVGNGRVYDEYCRSGVPDFVYLAGFSENSVGYYAASDIGIMLTKFKSESFPLTIVDCLFAGKPYIATDVGEIRNMLSTEDSIAGAVVELDNWEVPVEKAAAAIARLASDREAYQSASACVKELADRYHIEAVASQYVRLFEAGRNNSRLGDRTADQ
ncbi:glycoside hydrolase family 99-like domain-containing protein [Mesorhizobium sp. ESP6-5]|uniref:glycoside hydrolase family 99-like domain-containing protein n=1 Tax=Mesorhizobium sp. ESP6-5 TaxID=2876623 RepID=UPI001CCE9E4D|nr:glycoside hydrolase family 99-like domain-containing protein [Mesorhizobium sp. ESP6-5]MBZ9755786.1 glycoside hydrolase family 99-like domain-containing protein [Mesorhizobium sp. ESP6-5]